MKNIVLAVLLLQCVVSYGQKSRYKPFKMVIIAPDTAIIHDQLKIFTDTIESGFIDDYYQSMLNFQRDIDEFTNLAASSPDLQAELESQQMELKKVYLQQLLLEPEINKFKYFETVSGYSSYVLQTYFNKDRPHSTFIVVRKDDLGTHKMRKIADKFDAEYVVHYKDIRTVFDDNSLVMKMTTTLYSRPERRTLFETETTGDANSFGELWTCSNPLSCLLVTSVRSSTWEIFQAIGDRQKL